MLHLHIVHTNAYGVETGWRGGPSRSTPPTIVGHTARYKPDFIDYDLASRSVTVDRGAHACEKTACFARELARIDAMATSYDPMGPNSNTWVSRQLRWLHLPRRCVADATTAEARTLR
jgi:hypothetical protein